MEQAVNAAINLDTVRAPQAARLVTLWLRQRGDRWMVLGA